MKIRIVNSPVVKVFDGLPTCASPTRSLGTLFVQDTAESGPPEDSLTLPLNKNMPTRPVFSVKDFVHEASNDLSIVGLVQEGNFLVGEVSSELLARGDKQLLLLALKDLLKNALFYSTPGSETVLNAYAIKGSVFVEISYHSHASEPRLKKLSQRTASRNTATQEELRSVAVANAKRTLESQGGSLCFSTFFAVGNLFTLTLILANYPPQESRLAA